jgi:hypothetical protein
MSRKEGERKQSWLNFAELSGHYTLGVRKITKKNPYLESPCTGQDSKSGPSKRNSEAPLVQPNYWDHTGTDADRMMKILRSHQHHGYRIPIMEINRAHPPSRINKIHLDVLKEATPYIDWVRGYKATTPSHLGL